MIISIILTIRIQVQNFKVNRYLISSKQIEVKSSKTIMFFNSININNIFKILSLLKFENRKLIKIRLYYINLKLLIKL